MSKTHHAYPQNPEVETVMRMSAVKRWHMIETTRTQTLAEHTANVSLLTWVIAHSSPGMFFPPLDTLLSAMVHDLAETFIGDIPTHSKPLIGKEAIDKAEASVLPQMFKRPQAEKTGSAHLLIKIADLADGIRFIRLHGVDQTAVHARMGLEQQFADRLYEAAHSWPREVLRHVMDHVFFYAYENTDGAPGVIPSQMAAKAHGRDTGNDLARGQGDQSRGAGPFLRGKARKIRDWMAGTESSLTRPGEL